MDNFMKLLKDRIMSHIVLGIVCGIIFGAVSVATMIPIKMGDKRRAMLGAFVNRFGIGFVICNVTLPWSGWFNGLLIGLLLSLPDAIITKTYLPILIFGAIGGTIIGYLVI
jgi:hypothetical protein